VQQILDQSIEDARKAAVSTSTKGYYHTHTGAWHVYDRLLRRRVHANTSALAAESVARDYEAAWRRLCDRWQQAEWRDVLL